MTPIKAYFYTYSAHNFPTIAPYWDIFGFVGPLITPIKKPSNYTKAIGKSLGFSAAVVSPALDTNNLQPVFSVNLQGGYPVLSRKNNGTNALKIEADHGTGSISLLTLRMSSGYQDNTQLPVTGSASVWKYRAIYHIHDQQIGHWSQVLEIGVKSVQYKFTHWNTYELQRQGKVIYFIVIMPLLNTPHWSPTSRYQPLPPNCNKNDLI